jgi:hypothetical protein
VVKKKDMMKDSYAKARGSMGYGKGNNAGMQASLKPSRKKFGKRPALKT